jgi:tRNA(Arg) A34 adenosine deaminase TadA
MGSSSRRSFLVVLSSTFAALITHARAAAISEHQEFINAAFNMKAVAVAAGDLAYGAVVVKEGKIVGLGPSRVVQKKDWTAHAEREAIVDAQTKLGTKDLTGCILYSTSHPCSACEAVARQANIARMIYGPNATEAGPPRP